MAFIFECGMVKAGFILIRAHTYHVIFGQNLNFSLYLGSAEIGDFGV